MSLILINKLLICQQGNTEFFYPRTYFRITFKIQ